MSFSRVLTQAAMMQCVKMMQWDKGALLHEIASPRELRHVAPEEVHDRSTPHVEPGTKVGPWAKLIIFCFTLQSSFIA